MGYIANIKAHITKVNIKNTSKCNLCQLLYGAAKVSGF